MFPLSVMIHLRPQCALPAVAGLGPRPPRRAYESDDSARETPRLYTARDSPAGLGDFSRRRVRAREFSLGTLVPAARVVEITLDDVHDAVNPRCEGRLLLLDDLVRLLPVARRQQLDRLP